MRVVINIFLSFALWALVYWISKLLENAHNNDEYGGWYIKPSKMEKNFGLYWLLSFFIVFLINR